jgi:hypothetical protein
MERSFTASPRTADPAGQPEIGETNQVIGMMMCEQQTGDIGKRDAELMQPLHGAAPGIEDKFLIAGFDQGARPEAVQERRRRSGSEQGHSEQIPNWFYHISSPGRFSQRKRQCQAIYHRQQYARN